MWDLPGPGIKPVSPALVGRFLTTGLLGKPMWISCGRLTLKNYLQPPEFYPLLLCTVVLTDAQSSPSPKPLVTTDLCSVFIVLSFPECHAVGIILYIVFSDWHPLLSNMHLRFPHVIVVVCALSHSVVFDSLRPHGL